MAGLVLTSLMLALNVGFWLFDAIPAARGVDPVIVCVALYGISHIEMLMIRAIWFLNKRAAAVLSGRTIAGVHA